MSPRTLANRDPRHVKKLPILCPQEYVGVEMRVTACTRCRSGWNRQTKTCRVETGIEHMPLVQPSEVPECPMSERCQHQRQLAAPTPCPVRARGMICESALAWAGDPDPANHPLGFNAYVIASTDDWEEP
jgi:hypothetical protein